MVSLRNAFTGPSPSLRDHIRALRLRFMLKYTLPREFFTLAIPLFLAFLIVCAGVGLHLLAGSFSEDAAAAEEEVDERALAYAQLVAQMEAEGEDMSGFEPPPGAENAADDTEDEAGLPFDPPSVELIAVLAMLIGLTPYAIDITLQKSYMKRKEGLYTEFLFKLSELMRGGLDPIKSVIELSKSDLGPLTPHIRYAANELAFGRSFEDSMRQMAAGVKSDLVKRYTDLVIQASYSGGSVSDLILRCSEDMRSILAIERQKEGDLKQFVAIFYFAQGIITFICYTLNDSLLPFLTDLGSSSFLGENDIANLDFGIGFTHLLLINALFGGLIIGKISEGDIRQGFKHVIILVTGTYIACTFLLLGGIGGETVEDLSIIVVSGVGQEGVIDLPLKDPLVVQVTDAEGNPVPDRGVSFEISPGGRITDSAVTDDEGKVYAEIVLGQETGVYTVTITTMGNEVVITELAMDV